MKLRIKFMTNPEMDKCLKEMQEIKDYMGGGYFMGKLIHKVNDMIHEREDIFRCVDKIPAFPPLVTVEDAVSFLQTFPLQLIDLKKKKLHVDVHKLYSGHVDYIKMFFEPEMWYEMQNDKLKSKILSWCKTMKKECLLGNFHMNYIELPMKTYEDGYMSVEFDMKNIPELGMMDEILIQENGSTVIRAVGGNRGFSTTNTISEDFFYEEDSFRPYEYALSQLARLIGDLCMDSANIGIGNTLIEEVCLVNDDGLKLQHIVHEEINSSSMDEIYLEFVVPGGKLYYDLDVSMNIKNSRVNYYLDIEVELKEELVEAITKYCNFVRQGETFGIKDMQKNLLGFELDALTWDYSPLANVVMTMDKSGFFDYIESEEKVGKAVKVDDNMLRYRNMMKDGITYYPEVVNFESGGVLNGKWFFKGVISGYTADDIDNLAKTIGTRVCNGNISVQYERVK